MATDRLCLLALRRRFVEGEIDAPGQIWRPVPSDRNAVNAHFVGPSGKAGDGQRFLCQILFNGKKLQQRLCRRVEGQRQRLCPHGEHDAPFLFLNA